MDTVHWPQEIGLVNPMEELVVTSTTTTTTPTTLMNSSASMGERRVRPGKEQALNCPRCNSTNTKFCYYNNYSLTQPRYFCKTCRRYWTEGGSLRNVPVGGGSRKNKRSSSSSSSTTTTTTTTTPSSSMNHPNKFHEGQDLNLAFPHPTMPDFTDFPNLDNPSCSTAGLSAMELLRRSGMSGRGLPPPFVPMPVPVPVPQQGAVYPSGFGLQELRPPTLSFPLVGGSGEEFGPMQGVQESAGRLLFPFEDLRQDRGQAGHPPPGFWNQMMGGGGSSW